MEAGRAAFWPYWTAVSLQVTGGQQLTVARCLGVVGLGVVGGLGAVVGRCLACVLGCTERHCVTPEPARTQLGHPLSLRRSRPGPPPLTLQGQARPAALPAWPALRCSSLLAQDCSPWNRMTQAAQLLALHRCLPHSQHCYLLGLHSSERLGAQQRAVRPSTFLVLLLLYDGLPGSSACITSGCAASHGLLDSHHHPSSCLR